MITTSRHRNQVALRPALLSRLLPAPAPETSGNDPRTGNGLGVPAPVRFRAGTAAQSIPAADAAGTCNRSTPATAATDEHGTHRPDSLHLLPCTLRCGNLCMIPNCIMEHVRRDRCVAVTSITVHQLRCAMCDARLPALPLPEPFCYLRWRTAARNTLGDRGAAVSLNRREGSSPLRHRPFRPDGVNRKQDSSFDARRRFLSHPTHLGCRVFQTYVCPALIALASSVTASVLLGRVYTFDVSAEYDRTPLN